MLFRSHWFIFNVTDIDRCNGALIGFAIGETLGAGVEVRLNTVWKAM